MNILPRKEIPGVILKDSVLANIAATYFSVGKRLKRKTQCSATRGFILSTLRDGATPNQNQIATLLGFDRTVVHRAVKSLAKEGLVSEHREKIGPRHSSAADGQGKEVSRTAHQGSGWSARKFKKTSSG